eukprot:scaffold25783_cov118-Isochrysis_galbana.AAC.3
MDEKTTNVSSGAEAHSRCRPQAPIALGANTRWTDFAVCDLNRPSARTPAACQTPLKREERTHGTPPMSRAASSGSATSHRAALTCPADDVLKL